MGSAARRFFALLMAAALLLTVQGTALSGAEDAMLSRLRAHSFVFAGIDCSDKKDTMLSTAEEMLSAGFAPAFVAGLLGNIACEGDFGRFENIFGYTESRIRTVFAAMIAAGKHVYVAHMQGLASLDGCGHDHSEYKPYSNRHIYEGFSLSAVSAMLAAYRQENWRAMFGLGTVQWSKERTVTLVEFYQSAAGGRDTITREECMAAETAMMRYELQHAYRGVYSNWMTANAAGLLTPGAASDAGDRVCLYYEGLTSESARARRSLLAELIFQAMQDGTTPEPAPTDTPLPTASMTPLPTCSAAPSPDVTATPAPTPTPVLTAPPDDTFRLNRSAYTIQLTKQRTFQLKPVFGDGQAHRVTYGTSDASIATVSGKGKITAKSVGVAVITAMAEDGRVRACRVTVKAPSASISSIKSASSRSITIKPKSGVSFSAWQVQFRRQGSAQWRTKSFTGRQGTITGLTSGAMMEARIRVRFTGADGKKFYTAWSKERTAAVR